MSVTRIASRYAKSLIDLAIEQKSLEEVVGDVNTVSGALENRDLQLLMKSPIVKASKKKQVMDALFQGKIGKTAHAFIDIIIRKGREGALQDILQSFVAQYRAMNEVSSAKIITATPLDDKTLETIKKKLLGSAVTEKNVELTTEVDPEIIGGYVIQMGDKLYDASVAHKIKKLRKELIS